jgi:hypothetical protein
MQREMSKPRAAASTFMLIGYECSRCGCRFPETRPPKGRTAAESLRLEPSHTATKFEAHICADRGW